VRVSVELMVNQWIQQAAERRASDIHLEPTEDDRLRVRMRVDGDLRAVETVADGRKVMARLKVMAGLDVNERGMPLDGRVRVQTSSRGPIDLRMSTTPCLGGEKAVLRLIDNSRLGKTLEELGYTKRMLAAYKPIVELPYGLLLHVGPTGSGKTTSLYAVLTTVNKPEKNIQTVEDPVEYDIPGVTQTQVNHDQGLTFPKVLRALLRQDPNVILIGEIRDDATAEIALEASMTGHLVLSTLHANEAVGAVVRLLDMGMTPYSIAYSLRSVIAQRFVKKLCTSCRKQVPQTDEMVRLTGSDRPVFEAEGCKDCNRSGFDGRQPLYEFLPMTAGMKKAIYQDTTPDHLQAVALKSGMISMFADGMEKAFAGVTTVEEVLRATKGVKASAGPAAPAGPPRPRLAGPARPGAPNGAGTRPAVRPATARPAGAPRPPRPPAR